MSSSPLWTDDPAQHDWMARPPRRPRPAPTPPEPPSPTGPDRRRRMRRAAAAAAAVLVLGGAVVDGTQLDGEADKAEAPQALPAAGGRIAPSRINAIYARAGRGVVSVRAG